MKEIETLIPGGFSVITPAMWKNFCEHVRKVEDEYWEKDALLEDAVEEFILQISDSDSDSENDDSSVVSDVIEDESDIGLQEEQRLRQILDQ